MMNSERMIAELEQAIKDEAANADRVAGLDNRYETVEMNFPHDAFATDNDFAAPGWNGKELADDTTNTLVYKGFNMQAYGTLSQPAKDNNTAYRASEIENVEQNSTFFCKALIILKKCVKIEKNVKEKNYEQRV